MTMAAIRERQRKPRFTNSELSLLVRAVAEYRHILFKKNANQESLEAKKDAWYRVAEYVNSGSVSQYKRTLKEVKKRWMDLVCFTKGKEQGKLKYVPRTNIKCSNSGMDGFKETVLAILNGGPNDVIPIPQVMDSCDDPTDRKTSLMNDTQSNPDFSSLAFGMHYESGVMDMRSVSPSQGPNISSQPQLTELHAVDGGEAMHISAEALEAIEQSDHLAYNRKKRRLAASSASSHCCLQRDILELKREKLLIKKRKLSLENRKLDIQSKMLEELTSIRKCLEKNPSAMHPPPPPPPPPQPSFPDHSARPMH